MARILRLITLLCLLSQLAGCSLLPHREHLTSARTQAVAQIPHPQSGGWYLSLRFPFLHHRPPPPRAQALRRVGVIRTLSADGTFVIIELEPGVMVSPGWDLVVTEGPGYPARLRSAESHPPYFIADVKSGQPVPGQAVFQ